MQINSKRKLRSDSDIMRKLHELLYTGMVKSGTIRLASDLDHVSSPSVRYGSDREDDDGELGSDAENDDISEAEDPSPASVNMMNMATVNNGDR